MNWHRRCLIIRQCDRRPPRPRDLEKAVRTGDLSRNSCYWRRTAFSMIWWPAAVRLLADRLDTKFVNLQATARLSRCRED